MRTTIEIEQDMDAQSPADWEDTGLFLVANHRECYIPEPGEKRITSDPQELIDKWKATHWIFPLEAYIHGGVVLALSREGNFPDRQWDVSQLGFVFASKEEWRLSKSARKAALSKVEEWNQYLSGDVWGFKITGPDGEHLDSCWGFYGREYCEQKASKAKAKKERAATAIPLVNPTDEDAERLQTIWNDEKKASLETDWQREKFEPATVCRIPQRVYSHYSKGSYAKAETKNVCALGVVDPGQYFHSYEKQARDAKERGPALCQVRTTPGEYNKAQPLRVIVLTDKPQKPLPAAVWEKYQPKTAEAWELA